MSIIDKVKEFIGSAQIASIAVDGVGGAGTVKALQKKFGLKQDGVVSGQNKNQEKYRTSLTAVKNGKGGSALVTAMQKWAGLSSPDGIWGKNTSKGIQKKLKSLGYFNGECDGYFGTASMKALQKWLNGSAPTPTPKTVKMGQACGSETGGYSGKAGDQNGRELLICNYSYSSSSDSPYHWTAVYRAKDAAARKVIGKACADACKNDYIGYDTSDPDRKSLYKEAKKVKWDIPKIKTKCETTCSELANVCLACAGLKHLGVNKNAYVDSLTAFLNKDDQVKKITSWTKNDLQVGDILRSDCHYAVIVSVK